MKNFFPTRQPASRDALHQRRTQAPHGSPPVFDDVARNPSPNDGSEPEVQAEQPVSPLWRFVVGIDSHVRPMSEAEIENLGDPFSRHVLAPGGGPQTVRALFEAIAAIDDPVFAVRKTFLVAEGGQARLKSGRFEFNGRLVVVWRTSDDAAKPDLMLSTVAAADDPAALLQLAAWSPRDNSFHFFERQRETGRWVWAGNSFHALRPESRGKGPFDSHINGALVMKELKAPWAHWHSVSATIQPEAFPPNSELLTEPLFRSINSAHELEPIVKTAVRRWTSSRVASDTAGGRLRCFPDYLRQILWCTSVNLVSSPRAFRQPAEGRYPLPATFFYDFDAIAFLVGKLDDEADVLPRGRLEVDATLYEQAVESLSLKVVDDSDERVSLPGDTHFAFLVPERAFEDLAILQAMVELQAISARTALSLLFVDFANPVFSPRRGALLAHALEDVALGDAGADFDRRFVEKARSAIVGADSAEGEFLDLFDDVDLLRRCRLDLAAFDAAIRGRLATPDGVRDIVDLAQSRRHVLALKRSLAEFRSTMAFGPNPKHHLAMRKDGSVFVKPSDLGEEEN